MIVTSIMVMYMPIILLLCCSGYNHPPKFRLSLVLEPPYQLFITSCLASSSTQALVFRMHKGKLSNTTWCIPLTGCSLRLISTTGWAASQRKLRICGGQLAFLPKIAQFYQPTLPAEITQISPVGLLSPEFVQIWAAVNCSAQKLCKSPRQLAQLLARNTHFL